jgi:hypothetical protein
VEIVVKKLREQQVLLYSTGQTVSLNERACLEGLDGELMISAGGKIPFICWLSSAHNPLWRCPGFCQSAVVLKTLPSAEHSSTNTWIFSATLAILVDFLAKRDIVCRQYQFVQPFSPVFGMCTVRLKNVPDEAIHDAGYPLELGNRPGEWGVVSSSRSANYLLEVSSMVVIDN